MKSKKYIEKLEEGLCLAFAFCKLSKQDKFKLKVEIDTIKEILDKPTVFNVL